MAVDFRKCIIERLKQRDQTCNQFEAIFASYNELTEYVSHLARTGGVSRTRSKSVNEMKKWFTLDGSGEESGEWILYSHGDNAEMELRAELAALYRKKEQNDQQLIETNIRLETLQRQYDSLLSKYDRSTAEITKLKKQIQELNQKNEELDESNRLTRDEHLALQITYENLAQKYQAIEHENFILVDSVKTIKEEQIKFLNEQNEKEERERRRLKHVEISAAIENSAPSSDERFEIIDVAEEGQETSFIGDILPVRNALKFECSEGEVCDVQWFPTGQYFATGGTDRKVRLFEVLHGKQEKEATLTGMNGSIMRLDFNAETRQVLAAGADFAVRVWGIDDHRSRHCLTGHSDKVSTAKFHAGGAKLVSGSHDRTIRIWDLSTRKCFKTLFPGSTVLDLVSNPQFNAMIISGHYDKKIRVWDISADEPIRKIDLSGRVTSVVLSSDSRLLLCSTRDETLSLIDLRNTQIVHVYSAEQYRSSYDYSRCTMSPGLEYCAAGSAEGQIFIWNIRSTKLETVLSRGGHDHAVTSVAWHPGGHSLLSADRMKTVCLWSP